MVGLTAVLCMAVGAAFNSSGFPVGIFSERWDGTLAPADRPDAHGSPGQLPHRRRVHHAVIVHRCRVPDR